MIFAELKKLLHNGTFCFFLCVLLLAGFLSPLLNDTDKNLSEAYNFYKDMSAEEVIEDTEYQLRLTDIRQTLDVAAQLPADVADVFLSSVSDEYNITREELAALAESADDAQYDAEVLRTIQAQAERITGYCAYLESIKCQEQTIANSILYKNNNYALTIAKATAEEYMDLAGLELIFADPTGVEKVLGTWIDDVIVCAIVCLTVMFTFLQERQEGMMPLLFSTKRGCRATYTAKIMLIAISGVFAHILLALFRTTIAGDLGDLRRPVQTIPAFYTSPYSISVGAVLVFSLIQRVIATLFVGFFLSLLCILLERSIALGVSVLIAGIELLCWQMIDSASVLQPLKYLSIPALFSDETLLGNAVFVKLFNLPIKFAYTSTLILFFGSAVLILLGSRVYSQSHKTSPVSVRNRKKHIKKRIPSLFNLEFRKLMFHQKAAVLLFLVIVLQPVFYDSFRSGITTDELRYLSVMKSVEGEYTVEKHRMLLDQQTELNEQLTLTTDALLSDELSDRLAALDRALLQADYLSSREEKVFFVYETGYLAMFGYRQIGIRYQPVLIAFVLCLILPGLFTLEKENGMDGLIRTTRGRRQLSQTKWKLGIILLLMAFLICWIPEIIYILNSFELSVWTAPAISLQMFSFMPGWIPIWFVILGLFLSRLFIMVVYGVIVSVISIKLGKYIPSTILSLMLLVPLLLTAMLKI